MLWFHNYLMRVYNYAVVPKLYAVVIPINVSKTKWRHIIGVKCHVFKGRFRVEIMCKLSAHEFQALGIRKCYVKLVKSQC